MNRKMRRANQKGANRPTGPRHRAGADTHFVNAFLDEGWRLLAAGRDQEATEVATRTVRLEENAETKRFFAECLKRWSYFPGAEQLLDLIVRALREPWVTSGELAGLTRGIFEHDPVIGPAIARAAQGWPRRLPLDEMLGPNGLAAIGGNRLLPAVLETGKIIGIDLERFLTSLRAGLLDLSSSERPPIEEAGLRLCCALARQCRLNEYVFDVAVDEAQRVAGLESRLIAGGAPLPALAVAVAACYTPFSGPLVSALLKRSWPEPLRELLDGISGEFAADRRHRKSIPSLTKIADHTSFAVAKQYEENPYPRWVGLPMLTPPMAVDEWFSRFMPFSPYRPIGKAAGLDLLIAGCGTGHHSILFAQSFPEPRTLAIDLSLASLCYAREKSRALGLDIEFAQADILELGGLERRFDIISSSGVLHHLGAPDRGWRTLLSLLRPDGCMHVGLYSELACRNTSMARDWLAQRGHRSSPDGIRRARQDLIAAAAQEPAFQDVLRYPDFYSTGECRDLLFHVQERRYTIPQIKSFLDEVGFQFLGFSIGPNVLSEFRRLNPGPSETDLDLWHQFETENPDTFKGMYQFWIQRRA